MVIRSARFLFVSCLLLLFSLVGVNGYFAASIQATKHMYSSSDDYITKLYIEAEAAKNNEEWDEAIQNFQVLILKYPQNPYLEAAKVCLMDCYAGKKDFYKAILVANQFIQDHPQSEGLKYVLRRRIEIEQQAKAAAWWNGFLGVLGSAIIGGLVGWLIVSLPY